MKEELIKRLETLLRDKPIAEIVDEVHRIEDQFNALIEEEEHTEVNEAPAEEVPAGETESEEMVAEREAEQARQQEEARQKAATLNGRYKELINIFHDRLDKYEEARKAEEEQNLDKKKEVLQQLREVITEEQNIGQAINKLRNLQRKWKSIGSVPAGKYRDLQNEYSFEIERFNYTLSIYKDLKELDLQKNLEIKQELVDKMNALTSEKSIKRMEMYVKAYQEEWEEAGPVPQEEWKNVRDAFREATRTVYEKINEHYDRLKHLQEGNLAKKKEIIAKAAELSELDLRSPKKWNEKTEEIKELQKKWRKIGRVPRKVNEETWQEFRSACNKFFERKREYFKALKEERTQNKAKKLELLKEAEKWKDSEDWKKATETIINLQKQWKETRAADRKDEQRLWTSFRTICDQFFERKKHFFETIDERQEENLKKKQALLKELESFQPSSDQQANLEKLREFNARWQEIGFIPKAHLDEINGAYHKLMDTKYSALGMGKKEKAVARFKNKVENIKQSTRPNSGDLRKEKRTLQDRLRKLDDLISKYETNMSFFTVSGNSSPLLDEAKKKIENARQDAQVIREKIKVIEQAQKKEKANTDQA